MSVSNTNTNDECSYHSFNFKPQPIKIRKQLVSSLTQLIAAESENNKNNSDNSNTNINNSVFKNSSTDLIDNEIIKENSLPSVANVIKSPPPTTDNTKYSCGNLLHVVAKNLNRRRNSLKLFPAEEDGTLDDLPAFGSKTDVKDVGINDFIVVEKASSNQLLHVRVDPHSNDINNVQRIRSSSGNLIMSVRKVGSFDYKSESLKPALASFDNSHYYTRKASSLSDKYSSYNLGSYILSKSNDSIKSKESPF
jgi:hypothetical protein